MSLVAATTTRLPSSLLRRVTTRAFSRSHSLLSQSLTSFHPTSPLPLRQLPYISRHSSLHQQCRNYATPISTPFTPITNANSTSTDTTTTNKTENAATGTSAAAEGAVSGSEGAATTQRIRPEQPSYELTFTCKPCSARSTHKISKQGYHKGTVLVQCPGCKNRHLIADHLRIFTDESTTIEDIMKAKGDVVKRGIKHQNGDVEILPPDEEGDEEPIIPKL